jgi:hypothetical protein
MDDLYIFIYRGILTEESLDRAGRKRRQHFGAEDAARMRQALAFDMLDVEMLTDATRMSIVYRAIHAFENGVRQLVVSTMADAYQEEWWARVPDRIQKKVKTRMDEDSKFRWHGTRGANEIMYCDFADLSSIIVTNWSHFEDILANLEWAKSILNTLEMSRNIVMHGGILADEDVERIGMNIRDWIRQAG